MDTFILIKITEAQFLADSCVILFKKEINSGSALFFWYTKSMIMGYHEWKACIEACLDCAAICNHCASSSCTKEEGVKMMAVCIDLDMQCASVCYAAAQLMSLRSTQAKELCGICAQICDACGTECGKHDPEHCKACAAACLRCAAECRKMAA